MRERERESLTCGFGCSLTVTFLLCSPCSLVPPMIKVPSQASTFRKYTSVTQCPSHPVREKVSLTFLHLLLLLIICGHLLMVQTLVKMLCSSACLNRTHPGNLSGQIRVDSESLSHPSTLCARKELFCFALFTK